MMEPRKITPDALKRVLADLKTGNEKAIGTWLFKGYRVQVSRYKSSGTERSALLYRKRRDEGLCVRCGAKVTRKNPLTGALYQPLRYPPKRDRQKIASNTERPFRPALSPPRPVHRLSCAPHC